MTIEFSAFESGIVLELAISWVAGATMPSSLGDNVGYHDAICDHILPQSLCIGLH